MRGNVNIVYEWQSVFNNYEPGEYVINFYAVDESGNKSEIVSRVVRVGNVLDMTSIAIIVSIVALAGLIMVCAIKSEKAKKRINKGN